MTEKSIDIISKVKQEVGKWVLIMKDCVGSKKADLIFDWEACIGCVKRCDLKKAVWIPRSGIYKFDVDGVMRDKPGLAGRVGVLCSALGGILIAFSSLISVIDSNEAEL